MGQAAAGKAAGGQAALAAKYTTDLATLRRVAAALLAQLGGTMPAQFPGEAAGRTGECLERRDGKPRFEVVSRDGSSPYYLISTDAREIWRELRNE